MDQAFMIGTGIMCGAVVLGIVLGIVAFVLVRNYLDGPK